MDQEKNSPNSSSGFLKKIIVVRDDIKLWRTEEGITVMRILESPSNRNGLDL